MTTTEEIAVLLVEDNPDDAVLAQRALRRLSVPVKLDHVVDGVEGRERLKHALSNGGAPQIVLCDLKMPRMGGIELLRWFRSQPGTEDVFFVMLTSSMEPDDIEACRASGATGYIQKPVDYDDYMTMMRSVLKFWLVPGEEPADPIPPQLASAFLRFR